LLALAWTARARAHVALTQGLFLGVLGLGVIGFAIWRAFNATLPEAELMGMIGIVALAVNVSDALVLSRFPLSVVRTFGGSRGVNYRSAGLVWGLM
jgi:Co/Zn/Cd efflux system component